MVSAIKASHFVHAHATDIGGRFELSAKVVAPLVIGASDDQAGIAGFGDQLHAAVAAHVVKHSCATLLVSHHHQWQSHKHDGEDAAGFCNIATKAQARPGLRDDRIPLFQPFVVAGVGPIG